MMFELEHTPGAILAIPSDFTILALSRTALPRPFHKNLVSDKNSQHLELPKTVGQKGFRKRMTLFSVTPSLQVPGAADVVEQATLAIACLPVEESILTAG